MKNFLCMNMRKSYVVILWVWILITLDSYVACYAQRTNNPLAAESLFKTQVAQSPITSSLMKNILYPINYNVGLPEIKIPLYEINDGDITLPIYLSYHASGVKVNDCSGWVGQSWTLIAEPIITRKVNGMDDSSRNLMCNFDRNYFRNNLQYCYNLSIGAEDEQPDEFYYNLPNKQGLFMYVMEPQDSSSKFMSLPYDNIKIERSGKSFQITDDKGITYKFDGGYELGGRLLNRVAWKASSIVSSNKKDSLLFIYDTSSFNTYLTKMHNDYMVVIDNFAWRPLNKLYNDRGTPIEQLSTYELGVPWLHDCYRNLPDEWMQGPIVYSTVNNKTKSYQRKDDGQLVPDWFDYYISDSSPTILTRSQPVREICFRGGKVVFVQESSVNPRLKEIIVYATNGSIFKRINFEYKNINDRYYLESLNVFGGLSIAKEKYQFHYHSPWLPSRESKSIDYWGYYNGIHRADSVTLVPRQTIDAIKEVNSGNQGVLINTSINLDIGSSLSRESDERYMMYGSLSSITYPTGSRDEFVYEAHRYRDELGLVKVVGGLRIKQINTLENDTIRKIRTFRYGEDEDGIGKVLRPINFEDFAIEQTKCYVDVMKVLYYQGKETISVDPNQNLLARCRTFLCNPLFDMNYSGGSPVMYDFVTEYNGTPEANSGKTVYEFDVMPELEEHTQFTTITGKLYRGWQYGHLKSKSIYRNVLGQYVCVNKVDNIFSCDEKKYGSIITGEAFHPYVFRPGAGGFIPPSLVLGPTIHQERVIDVKSKLLMSVVEKNFFDNSVVEKKTKYEYSDLFHVFVTRQIDEMNGGFFISNFTYPNNYKNQYPYTDMVKRNMLNYIINKECSYNDSRYQIETPYFSPSIHIYKPRSLTMRSSKLTEPESRFMYNYDDRGYLLESNKDNLESVVYLWGYNNKYIIAKICNSNYAEIIKKIPGGEEGLRSIRSLDILRDSDLRIINDLRLLLPNAQVTTYTYDPLVGMKTMTDPLGICTCYEYDDLGRLKGISVINNNKSKKIQDFDYHYLNP